MTTTIGVIAVSICLTFIFTIVIKIVDRANRKEVKLLEQENSFNHDMMIRRQAIEMGQYEDRIDELEHALNIVCNIDIRYTQTEIEGIQIWWARKKKQNEFNPKIKPLSDHEIDQLNEH